MEIIIKYPYRIFLRKKQGFYKIKSERKFKSSKCASKFEGFKVVEELYLWKDITTKNAIELIEEIIFSLKIPILPRHLYSIENTSFVLDLITDFYQKLVLVSFFDKFDELPTFVFNEVENFGNFYCKIDKEQYEISQNIYSVSEGQEWIDETFEKRIFNSVDKARLEYELREYCNPYFIFDVRFPYHIVSLN